MGGARHLVTGHLVTGLGAFAREGLDVPVDDPRQLLCHRRNVATLPAADTLERGAKVPRSMTRTSCRALPPDGGFVAQLD